MNLIKNAFVFFADLPDLKTMDKYLQALPYEKIQPTEACRSSFVVNEMTAELVTPIEGGYAFTYRYDKKDLPASVVNSRLADMVKEIEEQTGEKVDRATQRDMRDQLVMELLRVALVKTTKVEIFVHTDSNMLVIASSSAGMCDNVLGDLLNVCGSLGANKVRIDGLPQLLTSRLLTRIDEGEPAGFGAFHLGSYVQMKGTDGNKATFETDGVRDPADGIHEAARAGCLVERLELMVNGAIFRLTKDFDFKSFKFADMTQIDGEEEDWADDQAGYWRHEAGVQLLMLDQIVQDLCAMFEYVPQITKAGEDESQAEQSFADKAA